MSLIVALADSQAYDARIVPFRKVFGTSIPETVMANGPYNCIYRDVVAQTCVVSVHAVAVERIGEWLKDLFPARDRDEKMPVTILLRQSFYCVPEAKLNLRSESAEEIVHEVLVGEREECLKLLLKKIESKSDYKQIEVRLGANRRPHGIHVCYVLRSTTSYTV